MAVRTVTNGGAVGAGALIGGHGGIHVHLHCSSRMGSEKAESKRRGGRDASYRYAGSVGMCHVNARCSYRSSGLTEVRWVGGCARLRVLVDAGGCGRSRGAEQSCSDQFRSKFVEKTDSSKNRPERRYLLRGSRRKTCEKDCDAARPDRVYHGARSELSRVVDSERAWCNTTMSRALRRCV